MNGGIERGEWPSDTLPEHWAWATFDQFWADYTDSQRKVPQNTYLDNGALAVVDQGEGLIGGYTNDETMRCQVPLPAVVFGDHTRAVKFIECSFAQGADGVRVLAPRDGIDKAFAYQALRCVRLPDKGYSRHFKFLKDTAFPLAPLPEQRRIVAKIDSLSAKSKRACDHLDHIPRLVEKYKQAILAAAFRGELTRTWRGQKPELREWSEVTVSEIAKLIFDGPFGSNLKSSDYTAAGIRVVRLENVGHLKFIGEKKTYISREKYDLLKRHTLEPDDVIFSSFVDEQVRVALYPIGEPTAAINKADCFCVRVDPSRCSPRFLAFRLATQSAFEQFRSMVHGATRPRIALSQLKAFRFSLPDRVEQEEIVRRIETAFSWIDRLASETTSARKLIDHLDQAVLAKAFRGELVPQDPNDEPASVLLERIRAERMAQPAGNRARGRKKAS